MIILEDVGKRYQGRNFDVHALSGVNITIPAGQFVSVVGRSGSGKSTLLKILGLLDFDHSGSYTFGGKQFTEASDRDVSPARSRIGYVFQDFRLVGRHTIRRNLELAMVIRTGSHDNDTITQCLEQVQMADKDQSYPDELSGGQKQRAAIARAMVGGPDLIIADEPTGALDSTTSEAVMDLVCGLNAERGCAVVLVTHDADVARRAERTIQLVDGAVVGDALL